MAVETFGNTNKEAIAWNTGGQINACKFMSGSAGTLEKMSVYIKQSLGKTPNIKCCLYDAARNKVANGETEELLLEEAQDGWMHFNFLIPPTILAATEYWLAYWNNDSSSVYRGPGSSKQTSATGAAYNGWPASLGAGIADWVLSMYCTYVVANQAPSAPTLLLCEGETDPVEVIDSTPELSAVFSDPDAGDQANALQIQVGSTPGANDKWDSGWLPDNTVQGERCSDISYAGTALAQGTKYYWRIRFRDDDDAEGAWSSWQQFFVCAAAAVAAPGGLLTQIW